MSKITLFGLYQYTDGAIFDGIRVPDGVSRGTLIDTIILNGGEFGVVYTDPDFLSHQIATLSDTFAAPMARTWRALREDYNPLHNYDRYEESDDSAKSDAESTSAGNGVSRASMQGDTATAYTPVTQNADESTATGTGRSTAESKHRAHLYGQIGVTKYSELIQDELKTRTENNFYTIWAQMFISEICIGIY